jgi:pimeloyl-ACP methyl ester carboxylesterase
MTLSLSLSLPRSVLLLSSFVCACMIGCANNAPAVAGAISSDAPTTTPATRRAVSNKETFHIHLPGIGGYRGVDRALLRGLQDGGFDANLKPYDWTGEDAGLAALVATQRHRAESTRIAKLIAERAARRPGERITVTAHSAGAGIITWALEQLPTDVQVDAVVFIAPALSPEYDLSRALAHVRDKVYILYSPYDAAVLGMGTKMLGTVDGVKAEASGKLGFTMPPTADRAQYNKLVQIPYQSEWIKLGNIGDHIGGMSRPFARGVIAPLLARGELPVLAPQTPADATTKPAEPLSVPPPLPTTSPARAPATIPAPAAPAR